MTLEIEEISNDRTFGMGSRIVGWGRRDAIAWLLWVGSDRLLAGYKKRSLDRAPYSSAAAPYPSSKRSLLLPQRAIAPLFPAKPHLFCRYPDKFSFERFATLAIRCRDSFASRASRESDKISRK